MEQKRAPLTISLTLRHLFWPHTLEYRHSDALHQQGLYVEVDIAAIPEWTWYIGVYVKWSIKSVDANSDTSAMPRCWNPVEIPPQNDPPSPTLTRRSYLIHPDCRYFVFLDFNAVGRLYDVTWYSSGQILALVVVWLSVSSRHSGQQQTSVMHSLSWKSMALAMSCSLTNLRTKEWHLWQSLDIWTPMTSPYFLLEILKTIFVTICSMGLADLLMILLDRVWFLPSIRIMQSVFSRSHTIRRWSDRCFLLMCTGMLLFCVYLHPALICLFSIEGHLMRYAMHRSHTTEEHEQGLTSSCFVFVGVYVRS